MKRRFFAAAGSVLIILSVVIAADALSVNQVLTNPVIKDPGDQAASIPDFGSKVLTIVYSDSDASDICDPIIDGLLVKNYPESKKGGVGIANLKDSPYPNWILRKVLKRKVEKYHKVILLDDNHKIPEAWGFGDCNNKAVYIILGKDKKIKFFRIYDKKNRPTQDDIDSAAGIVDALMK